MKELKIDIISDIHVDQHIPYDKSEITLFVNHITKDKDADVLIIAGDIANSNRFSKEILKQLEKIYEKIFVVFGNHDLWALPELHDYYGDKLGRWKELKKDFLFNKKITFLDGKVENYKGFNFGGTGGWYDWSYTIEHLNLSIKAVEGLFSSFNDSSYIPNMKKMDWGFVNDEWKKIQDMNNNVDIMITHIPPKTNFIVEPFKKDLYSGAFSFRGDFLIEETSAKVWIFGHTHTRQDFVESGVRFINNAFEENIKTHYSNRSGVKTIILEKDEN